ncbi:hypothetical protein SEPCBS119000_003804 [Sporothrix epigloea]|uniref:Amine oxidase domain-containing protein n=1 Tax=Sporothrix epigloea TaxID=1892477 RepID=A0ABP0DNP1_9PEZI
MDVYTVFSSTNHDRPLAERARSPGKESPHIGVVGGGIAGLRCADFLLQHGFRVTILEGRNRLGGRLHQTRLGQAVRNNNGKADAESTSEGYIVDMGPNWIHGTKDNPILDLVRATETVACRHDMDEQGVGLGGAVFDDNGAMIPLDEGEALSTIMWSIIEEAFVHSAKNCSDIDPGESLYDFFEQQLDVHISPAKTSNGAEIDDFARKRKRILQMAEFWGAFVGSPVARQSLRYFWLEECIEGVLDRLAEPVLAKGAVHYGRTVTRVISNPGGSHSDSHKTGRSSVSVETSSREVYTFDEVVCTMPLGWLKKNGTTAFEPALPPRLSQAITNIGYGSLEKVYISFPEAFWQRPDAETGRSVRGFYQWLAPGLYAQPSNPEHWPLEAFDMAALPGSTAHPTLLFYTYGEQSVHITETLAAMRNTDDQSDEPIETRCPNAEQTAFLVDYFRPYFSSLPHYDPVSPACQPTGILATNWLHDDLAGNGSYSNFQVGLVAGDDDIKVMREGLPGRGLWFAGEHTSPFVALGTATGAYWSGEAVGRRIAQVYGHENEAAATMVAEDMACAPKLHALTSFLRTPDAGSLS